MSKLSYPWIDHVSFKVADGRLLPVKEKTCPMRVALHTGWGPVAIAPFSFAVMPGNDDFVIIGSPTLKMLGTDVYDSLGERAKAGRESEIKGVETASFSESRRVSMSVEALQQRVYEEKPDTGVERLVERGPNMTMSPAQEEAGRHDALQTAVRSAAAAGLSDEGVSKLRNIVGRRWGAFRRALRGDPPARVEPLTVTLKPGAKSVKGRPQAYNPTKTTWLATCLTTLLAMGLVFLNEQAIWASAVMATPKKGGFRMVRDNRKINQVPGSGEKSRGDA